MRDTQLHFYSLNNHCPFVTQLVFYSKRNYVVCRLEETFLTVEVREDEDWVVVAGDSDWETKITWKRTNPL